MSALPISPAGATAPGATNQALDKLTVRYFDRFTTDGLISIRNRVSHVLDDRARQRSLFEPEASPALAVAPAAPAPNTDIAAVLSPSQVNCFVHDCQMKWYYRSVLKLPETQDANRALGRAVHEAIAHNHRQKIDTREDLAIEVVRAVFRDSLDRELAESALTEEDNADDLRACGEVLLATYMDAVAPSIQPAACEFRVAGDIGGVAVQGYVDVMGEDGTIYDVKTAAKKPSGVRPDYRVQTTTYAMLEPRCSGTTVLHTITKTKTVALHQQTIDVTEADRTHARKLYQIAQEGMRAGLYLPNRSSFLCSRKYCSFWSRCADEFGGEVD